MTIKSIIDDKKKKLVRGAIEKDDPSMLWPKKGDIDEPLLQPERGKGSHGQEKALANSRLFREASIGNPDGIMSALAAGADIETKGAHGETVLLYACFNNRKEAAGALIAAGADPNARDDCGITALMAAAANGYREIVALLIEAKADVNVHEKDGMTALRYAVLNKHMEIAKFLRQKGAKE